jgi:hypothetical protein
MIEAENWYDDYLDSLPTDNLSCVRDKANPEKIEAYCRVNKCPNLVEKHALESKPGEMFGNKHSLQEGLNISSKII